MVLLCQESLSYLSRIKFMYLKVCAGTCTDISSLQNPKQTNMAKKNKKATADAVVVEEEEEEILGWFLCFCTVCFLIVILVCMLFIACWSEVLTDGSAVTQRGPALGR